MEGGLLSPELERVQLERLRQQASQNRPVEERDVALFNLKRKQRNALTSLGLNQPLLESELSKIEQYLTQSPEFPLAKTWDTNYIDGLLRLHLINRYKVGFVKRELRSLIETAKRSVYGSQVLPELERWLQIMLIGKPSEPSANKTAELERLRSLLAEKSNDWTMQGVPKQLKDLVARDEGLKAQIANELDAVDEASGSDPQTMEWTNTLRRQFSIPLGVVIEPRAAAAAAEPPARIPTNIVRREVPSNAAATPPRAEDAAAAAAALTPVQARERLSQIARTDVKSAYYRRSKKGDLEDVFAALGETPPQGASKKQLWETLKSIHDSEPRGHGTHGGIGFNPRHHHSVGIEGRRGDKFLSEGQRLVGEVLNKTPLVPAFVKPISNAFLHAKGNGASGSQPTEGERAVLAWLLGKS